MAVSEGSEEGSPRAPAAQKPEEKFFFTFCRYALVSLWTKTRIRLRIEAFKNTFLQCCGSMTFFVWIRIRIRRSMPLTNGSGSGCGPFYFHHCPSRC